jgi:GNAT superfamily N-acetyltransferase
MPMGEPSEPRDDGRTGRDVRVRRATPADVPFVLEMIHALARYERLEQHLDTDAGRLHEHLFGERPVCEALIGEVRGRGDEAGIEAPGVEEGGVVVPGGFGPAGFALFFTSYTTFTTRPCLWLEDLFVVPEARGHGLGKALLAALAAVAVERGMPRLDWYVLDWNEPAIGFYRRLGARLLDDWRVCRLDGDALRSVAGSAPS